jgi:hypothetical protein
MFRIIIQHINILYDKYKTKDIFNKNASLKNTTLEAKEFAFF